MSVTQSVKTYGLVIRNAEYKDYDKIVEIFTPELGTITLSAKGVRKIDAKLRPAAELFSYGEFVLAERAGKYTLTGFECMDSFTPLRQDVLQLSFGTLILESLGMFSFSPAECGSVFSLALRSIHHMAYADMPAADAVIFFMVQLLALIGYSPHMEHCVSCGYDQGFYFRTYDGGLVCADCKREGDIPMCAGTIAGLTRILETAPEDMRLLRFSPTIRDEFLKMILPYMEHIAEKRFKSLKIALALL